MVEILFEKEKNPEASYKTLKARGKQIYAWRVLLHK
jgi:hypothetical protein